MKVKVKNLLLKAGSFMASFAFLAAVWGVNSTCAFCTYQDELPTGAEKYSKVK